MEDFFLLSLRRPKELSQVSQARLDFVNIQKSRAKRSLVTLLQLTVFSCAAVFAIERAIHFFEGCAKHQFICHSKKLKIIADSMVHAAS